MAVKIRLMRIGTNNRPYYRVVAVDERRKRTGGYLELLGTYNPLTEPKEINLDQTKIDAWIKKGAQLSYGFLRIIGKAPQRAPRKAKKPARNASQSDAGGAPKEPSAIITEPSSEAPEAGAPVVSEESIAEAPMPEAAADAAEVLETKTGKASAAEPETSETPAPESSEAPAEDSTESEEPKKSES